MYFDASFLEDPILPFPDLPNQADVQIEVDFTSPLVTENRIMTSICPFETVTITDSIFPMYFYEDCIYMDSIIFTNDPDFPLIVMPPIGLGFAPWTGRLWTTIEEPEFKTIIYPNPTSAEINVELEQALSGVVELLDVRGQVFYKSKLEQRDQINVSVREIPRGIYILKITSGNYRILKKILVVD